MGGERRYFVGRDAGRGKLDGKLPGEEPGGMDFSGVETNGGTMLHKTMPDREHLARAKSLESEGEIDEAMEVYQQVLRNDPLNETAIGRLLVLYRRQKEYKKELALLKAAIGAYEAGQLAAQEAWRKKHQKAARISLSLARKLGGGGAKKGAAIYDDRLVTTWRKRKAAVMKRLKG